MVSIGTHDNATPASQRPPQTWSLGIDATAAVVLLTATAVSLMASRTASAMADTLWQAMPLLFGVIAFGLSWVHRGPDFTVWKAALREAASWLGVYLAILVVLHFIETDLFTAAAAGFACAVLLALGTFLSGIHGQWRLAPLGAAMFAGTAVLAIVEENLWLLIGIGVLAVALVLVAGRLQAMIEGR
jgi:hypothetical protein